ncbi:Fc.00g113080.m01.CDS01 [Cosmosporella sp. VM-42]
MGQEQGQELFFRTGQLQSSRPPSCQYIGLNLFNCRSNFHISQEASGECFPAVEISIGFVNYPQVAAHVLMALRIAGRRAPRSWSLCGIAVKSQRLYSTGNKTTYFSVEVGSETQDVSSFLDVVKKQAKLANPERHDAAVLLTTPQFTKWLDNEAFMKEFVSFMSGSEKLDQFHVLSAVVDHVAPRVPRNEPVNGFSVLRGRLDDILPDLWTPDPPRAREDLQKVAALTFDIGKPRLTIPLSNTTFQNHRTSTLLASRFNMTEGTPRLEEQVEKHSQAITLPASQQSRSITDLGLWAPLVPLTYPRFVTESFGNIVRRISVQDDSVPASIELEPAVDELFKRRAKVTQGPMGVWAMITPPSFSPNGIKISDASDPDPEVTFDENHDVQSLVTSTSGRLQELYGQGGRLYQILSGGGGWGAKKGLLSLDPQRTHFALSEEEEMQRFIQAMDGGNFVPVGSKIQFFTSPEASANNTTDSSSSSIVFGTAGVPQSSSEVSSEARVLDSHFGALSNDGVFISSAEHGAVETTPGFNNEWKLNVPNSRIFVETE